MTRNTRRKTLDESGSIDIPAMKVLTGTARPGERSFWMSKKRARRLDVPVQGHASSWRLCV
ncbi:hypothetical protein [Caballeronia udeis]|nr:hypothetical protein [Caballeronia udeis]